MNTEIQTIEENAVSNVADMGNAMLTMFERVLLDPNVPVDRIEKMMELQERWEVRQAEKNFEIAMSAVKADLPTIAKNRKGHNSRYADLEAIATAVDPILAKHKFSYRYETSQNDNSVSVTCVLAHADGCKARTTIAAGADTSGSKNSIQAIGSTLTYLQRYSLIAALGLTISNDDDGHLSGSGAAITKEQMRQIMDLIGQTNTDVVAFCNYLKIDAVADLPASKYQDAISALKKKQGA